MKAIDIHAHFLPELLVKKLSEHQNRFPYIKVEAVPEGTVRFKVGDGKWTRPVHPNLMNISKRKQSLRENEIDLQINAGWLDIFGYNLPPEQGIEWSRFLNDTLLEAIEREGDNKFLALATVPLQDGELAARELERSMKDGHLGVMVGSWIDRGEEKDALDLDHSSLEPFWQKASELGAPVFLHPVFAGEDPRTKPLGMVNTVARPNETTVALSRLLYSGIPQRYPGVKIIVSHGGGTLPYILGRLQRNYDFLSEKGEDIYNPSEGFKFLYFDSVVFEPKALKFLLDMVEEEKILLGSDDPFPIRDPRPRRVIEAEELKLSEARKKALLYGNALKLFNIDIKAKV